MNLPNRLTVSRIFAAFVLVGLLACPWPGCRTAALLVFVLASLTDALDGSIARRTGQSTDFGALMDPLADKILITGVFIAFVGLRLVPAWMVMVLVAREFAVTGLRLLAASKGAILAAERGGKWKTLAQMITIIAALAGTAFRIDWAPWMGLLRDGRAGAVYDRALGLLVLGLMWVTVLLTLSSGWSYFRTNRSLWYSDV